jgi:hypothetical protein
VLAAECRTYSLGAEIYDLLNIEMFFKLKISTVTSWLLFPQLSMKKYCEELFVSIVFCEELFASLLLYGPYNSKAIINITNIFQSK